MRHYFALERARFSFVQTPKSFFVEELLGFEPKGRGEYLLVRVQKVGLSTWEAIDIFQRAFDAKVGYAGLKDKNGVAIQHFTIPKSRYRALKRFYHPKLSIKEIIPHNRPLKVGELLGNRFRVLVKAPSSNIAQVAQQNAKVGVPNYFGYQRFGGSLPQAKALIEGDFFTKDKRLERFLLRVYQSFLFNRWLSKRVELSKDRLKCLRGDIYFQDDWSKEQVPTGPLFGKRVPLARKEAGALERELFEPLPLQGARRAALVFPKELEVQKNELSFILPKGSYATIFLESLLGKEFDHKGV